MDSSLLLRIKVTAIDDAQKKKNIKKVKRCLKLPSTKDDGAARRPAHVNDAIVSIPNMPCSVGDERNNAFAMSSYPYLHVDTLALTAASSNSHDENGRGLKRHSSKTSLPVLEQPISTTLNPTPLSNNSTNASTAMYVPSPVPPYMLGPMGEIADAHFWALGLHVSQYDLSVIQHVLPVLTCFVGYNPLFVNCISIHYANMLFSRLSPSIKISVVIVDDAVYNDNLVTCMFEALVSTPRVVSLSFTNDTYPKSPAEVAVAHTLIGRLLNNGPALGVSFCKFM